MAQVHGRGRCAGARLLSSSRPLAHGSNPEHAQSSACYRRMRASLPCAHNLHAPSLTPCGCRQGNAESIELYVTEVRPLGMAASQPASQPASRGCFVV